jgi:hydrogenase expression/formation protein HypC
MCLAVPMRLESINGDVGIAELGGVKRKVGLTLIDDPKVGDYLLIHAGFAIQKVDEKEAKETLELLSKVVGRIDP